jgi:hypothetical protein
MVRPLTVAHATASRHLSLDSALHKHIIIMAATRAAAPLAFRAAAVAPTRGVRSSNKTALRRRSCRGSRAPVTTVAMAAGATPATLGSTFTTWLLKEEQEGRVDNELACVLSSVALACKQVRQPPPASQLPYDCQNLFFPPANLDPSCFCYRGTHPLLAFAQEPAPHHTPPNHPTYTMQIASQVQRAGISGMTDGRAAGQGGAVQEKRLDVVANDIFCDVLRASGRTGVIASAEAEAAPVAVEETYGGNYVVVFDPLDGSSNVDAAVSTGSIFGVYASVGLSLAGVVRLVTVCLWEITKLAKKARNERRKNSTVVAVINWCFDDCK